MDNRILESVEGAIQAMDKMFEAADRHTEALKLSDEGQKHRAAQIKALRDSAKIYISSAVQYAKLVGASGEKNADESEMQAMLDEGNPDFPDSPIMR